MMNSCWSTSTTIYIEPCGKPKPTTTVASTPISNAKAPISAWYNINETVSWNYEYACLVACELISSDDVNSHGDIIKDK